jgi:hypothetical protein
MDRKAAKELVHIRGWLERVDEITQRGKETYLADALLQEAGDSLMMKLGEAANRLSRLGVLAPTGRHVVAQRVRRDGPRRAHPGDAVIRWRLHGTYRI